MSFSPDNTDLSLSLQHAAEKVTGWVGGASASMQLAGAAPLAPMDARLAPRHAMDHTDIEISTLARLGGIGLRHGKLVTKQSHPELIEQWQRMAQRARLPAPPQLILVQSDVPNAFTLDTHEVVITSGLLNMLTFREVVAVLGHELGHEQSEHQKPRKFWMGIGAALGIWAGNEFGRHGGVNMMMHRVGKSLPLVEKARGVLYPFYKEYRAVPSSTLGSLMYMSAAATVGMTLGKHLSVRPTELDADAKGAYISQDPEALSSALRKIDDYVKTQPTTKQWLGKIKSGYPSTRLRIEQLKQHSTGSDVAARDGGAYVSTKVQQASREGTVSNAPPLSVF